MEENKLIEDRKLLLSKLSTFLDARTRSELCVDELLELQGIFCSLYFFSFKVFWAHDEITSHEMETHTLSQMPRRESTVRNGDSFAGKPAIVSQCRRCLPQNDLQPSTQMADQR
jgi:hypothetical protein